MTGSALTNGKVYVSTMQHPEWASGHKANGVEKPESRVQLYKWQIAWVNTLTLIYVHIAGLYGFLLFFTSTKLLTLLWAIFVFYWSMVGITIGAHRLWSHRAYKAKVPLRIILMLFHTIAFQHDTIKWVQDHRAHHKFTDTDADPHNSRRGFFFSHIGWLLIRKHPDVIVKGKTIDSTDLTNDPVLMWQRRHFLPVGLFLCYIMPSLVPWYFWDESMWNAWHCAAIFRYMFTLNATWTINSFAHIWGSKPYDRYISSTNSGTTAFIAFGEGWHNYHHTFPQDYRMSELGSEKLDFGLPFLEFFAWLGQAYDLKTTSLEMVKQRTNRTGDGSWIEPKSIVQNNSAKDIDDNHLVVDKSA